jgi:hypothetical protein
MREHWLTTNRELADVARVADPHHFNADPDPAFHLNADLDPACHFNADPDPAPHHRDGNLSHWSIGFHFEPLGLHCEAPRPSTARILNL